jgi:hypothetical protein
MLGQVTASPIDASGRGKATLQESNFGDQADDSGRQFLQTPRQLVESPLAGQTGGLIPPRDLIPNGR